MDLRYAKFVNSTFLFATVLAISSFTNMVSASDLALTRTPAGGNSDYVPNGGRSGRTSFQAVSAGRELSQKDILFRTILSTEGKDLSWPSFPRTWHEQGVSDYLLTSTTIGANAMGVGGSASTEYKWTLKTSLVMIAGNRKEESALDSHGVTIAPAADPLQLEIFKWDPATRRALPNVRNGYPIVAFCAFEASMNVAQSAKGSLTFMGSGGSVENGRVRNINHTLFSRFFQVDGTQSALEMLDRICTAEYRKQVEDYVRKDFSYAVEELKAYTKSECNAEAQHDGPEGDRSCMDWHKRNFSSGVIARTVPRCMRTANGSARCQITARENIRCPMFWDPASRSLTAASFSTKSTKATISSDYEFPCDESAGYKCEMMQQPWLLDNKPYHPGTARCVRK